MTRIVNGSKFRVAQRRIYKSCEVQNQIELITKDPVEHARTSEPKNGRAIKERTVFVLF